MIKQLNEEIKSLLEISSERYLSVEPEGLVLYCGDTVEDRLDAASIYTANYIDEDIIKIAKKCFKNITDDIRVQWY